MCACGGGRFGWTAGEGCVWWRDVLGRINVYSVIRRSLGKLLVNLLQVAKRTSTPLIVP